MRILPLVCQGLIWALDNPESTGPSSANKLGHLDGDGPGKIHSCQVSMDQKIYFRFRF